MKYKVKCCKLGCVQEIDFSAGHIDPILKYPITRFVCFNTYRPGVIVDIDGELRSALLELAAEKQPMPDDIKLFLLEHSEPLEQID